MVCIHVLVLPVPEQNVKLNCISAFSEQIGNGNGKMFGMQLKMIF